MAALSSDALLALPCSTPAFVYDEAKITEQGRRLRQFADDANLRLLFAVKSLSVAGVLRVLGPYVSGFAVSSLFEAVLAREILGDRGTIHITSPAYKTAEIDDIAEVCDSVTFNSTQQLAQFRQAVAGRTSQGLRVNPQLSFVKDSRYDPCRKHSKLGVPLERLSRVIQSDPACLSALDGLLVHTNCESMDLSQLTNTVRLIERKLPSMLDHVEWLNLGGGYFFDRAKNREDFFSAVSQFQSRHGTVIYIEPGAAIAQGAATLHATVLDLFPSDDKTVAILDTSVNHLPEVFEYQFEPDILGHTDDGSFQYILAGCTCLAGDVFGQYAFTKPLEIGSRIVFTNAGAYTFVKAHMFNGINLPTIYALTNDGRLVLKKRFTYDDFISRCGVETRVTV